MIPVLETRRLRLRGFAPGDVESFAGFYASDAARFVGGPEDLSTTWRRLAAYAGCWMLRGFGKFVAEEKVTGDTVGIVGPTFPEGWPEPEVGYTILPTFHGRGYATEATVRCLSFVYDVLGWKTAMSAIVPGNDVSIKVAERLGAEREGVFSVPGYARLELYRHLPAAEFRLKFASLS
jgi:RimJ/RimL family protein N-acetyltransferase